ncbi:hypothetical protein TcCL_Unassigned05096 [Trypanosoma cruzi]|nr:hypothetical protein TcCL_Unassigned05096 [Trypanosoma cruzi]
MRCMLFSSLYLWRHRKVLQPAASQCWKKYGAATVRVSVCLYSRFNSSSKNGLGGSYSSGLIFFLPRKTADASRGPPTASRHVPGGHAHRPLMFPFRSRRRTQHPHAIAGKLGPST